MTLRQLLLIALITVAGGRAWAEETFSDHYDRAVALAQNDQHSEALKELQAAYAIRQLRRFGCIDRALDALERVEARLQQPEPDADDWNDDDVVTLADDE